MWSSKVKLKLGRALGEGEQGRVFEGLRLDPSTGLRQPVAVKILHSGTAVDLWRHEFSSLSAVRSPYCVRVLSFERVGGRPALILELVHGVSLTAWRQAGLNDPEDRREILAQVLAGLRDLRAHGSYHGDLSPNNVMIDERGVIRLLDFGLANGSGERTRCTLEFAAPERRRGSTPNFESDLYSLGCLAAYLGEDLEVSGCADLLDPAPARRSTPEEAPRPERAQSLARKVNALLAGPRGTGPARTENYSPAPRPEFSFGRVLRLGVASLALNLSSPASLARPGFGTVTVATSGWCEVRVDGHVIGFAPVSFPVTSDEPHVVACAGPRGTTGRPVRVKAGERRRLRDRDFSH